MTVTSRRLTREQIHVMPMNMSPHRKHMSGCKVFRHQTTNCWPKSIFLTGTSKDNHQSSLAAFHPLRDEIWCVHQEALTHHWLVWSSSSPRWAQAGQNGVRLPEWSQVYEVFSCSVSDSLNGAVRSWREDEPKVRREHLYTSLSLRDSYQWATSLQLVYSEQVLSVLIYIQSKPLTVWITTNSGKFLKRWEYQTTLPAS